MRDGTAAPTASTFEGLRVLLFHLLLFKEDLLNYDAATTVELPQSFCQNRRETTQTQVDERDFWRLRFKKTQTL